MNGQLLQVQAEAGNLQDSHAVSTVHGDTVVGHMQGKHCLVYTCFLENRI